MTTLTPEPGIYKIEHREKLAAALRGRKLSPETIAKRQATRKANSQERIHGDEDS